MLGAILEEALLWHKRLRGKRDDEGEKTEHVRGQVVLRSVPSHNFNVFKLDSMIIVIQ